MTQLTAGTRGLVILFITIVGWLACSLFKPAVSGGPSVGGNPATTYQDASDSPRPPQECRARIVKTSSPRAMHDIVKPRIVGGEVSKPGTWPFAVALQTQLNAGQYCGATLIRPSWVLTAGHCDVRVGEIAVIGRNDLRTLEGEAIPISEVRTHERFTSVERGYDVAVARLSRPSGAKVADLIQPTAGLAGTAVGIGYGATSEGGQTSPVLREVKLPLLTDTECLLAYPGVPVTALCAGYLHDGGKDTCQGDSGGGLFLGNYVIGITSYGEGCGREPGVYTNVAMVYDFIVACAME